MNMNLEARFTAWVNKNWHIAGAKRKVHPSVVIPPEVRLNLVRKRICSSYRRPAGGFPSTAVCQHVLIMSYTAYSVTKPGAQQALLCICQLLGMCIGALALHHVSLVTL